MSIRSLAYNVLDEKEIRESFDFVKHVSKYIDVRNQFQFKKRKVLEIGSGHGYIGLILLEMGSASLVHQVDVNNTTAHQILETYNDRLIFHQMNVWKNRDFLYDLSYDIIIGCHLCGTLTDFAIDLAIEKGVNVAVVPCCYTSRRGMEQKIIRLLGKRDGNDFLRCQKLLKAGYDVKIRELDETITPMNTIIIARHPEDKYK